jgi:hypothetical protein
MSVAIMGGLLPFKLLLYLLHVYSRSSYNGSEEDLGTTVYVCNEATDVVSLTETDKKHYRALFSSVLISYDNLKIGGEIGQGKYVCIII